MVMMMMTNLEMGSLSFNQQINHGIMGDHHGHDHGHHSNLPYSDDISSSESDLMEDGSISSGCSSPATSPVSTIKMENGALSDMSSLLQQLPIKRGLSKYFNGKSQSHSSLTNVTCLEDLAKPENPYNKKLKSCKSYMCFSEAQKSPPNVLKSASSSKLISKKSSSRSSSSSLGSSKRNGSSNFIIGNNNGVIMKPPAHPTPLRSTSTSSFNNCTPLFA